MRKILILLSLLVIALFVVSCAPKEAGEEGALAGQAVGSGKSVILKNCIDSDKGPNDNGLKYEVKGYVSGYKFNAKTKKYDIYYQEDDACVSDDFTTNLSSSNFVREMTCFSSTKTKSQVQNCLELAPKGTKTCVNGACVGAGVCGNKVLEGVEVCDDGNQAAGDGCSADCKSVEAGWKCDANGCKKVCVAGPTGNWDCINPAGTTYYYAKEMQDASCLKSYATNWQDKKWCGYGADSCKEDVGCCKDELTTPTYCEGSFLINKTKNSCTGEMNETKEDCLTHTWGYAGIPQTCGNKVYWGIGCYEPCTAGNVLKTTCYEGSYKSYNQYVCNSDGLNYNQTMLNSCPAGTTCQNGICKVGSSSSSSSSGGGNSTQ